MNNPSGTESSNVVSAMSTIDNLPGLPVIYPSKWSLTLGSGGRIRAYG
jgi:hypothetical protein